MLAASELDMLFREARSFNDWEDKAISAQTLRDLYDLAKWGATSANCSPGRFLFVQSREARERLAEHVSSSNRPKVVNAPVCVIIASDADFASRFDYLFPHNPGAASWFAEPEVSRETAFRNSTLQGAYFMLAARALGLDCGPMSGFDPKGVDEEFFRNTSWRSNFLCSIGHGKKDSVFPRLPRLPFDEACAIE